MSNSLFESLRFRMHVRNLVYDYVKRHCAVDYLTFTDNLCNEFYEDLQLISLTDPYALTLPVDPLDAIDNLCSNFPSYSFEKDDDMPTSQEAIAYLKDVVKIKAGKTKTDEVVLVDSYGPDPPHQTVYPALTARAHKSTKTLGSGNVMQFPTFKELFEEHIVSLLVEEKVEEPKVNLEDTLNVKISISQEQQPAVKSLLQSTIASVHPDKAYTNRYLNATFLCREFPEEPTFTAPADLFVPIFSRRLQTAISTTSGLGDFKSLVGCVSAPYTPVEVVNYEDDLSRQNIVLVDGWQAIQSSPPSTPSLDSRSGEEDELLFPSSPCTTPPPEQCLEKPMMDPVLMPRSRRLGGHAGITPHILHEKTIGSFLTPLLLQGSKADEGPRKDTTNFDVGIEIERLCDGYELEPDFVFNEKIDNKVSFLMEVPTLLQPSEFPKSLYVPKSISDFVLPSTTEDGRLQPNNSDFPLYRYLKKVTGLKSLSLALSWVPFRTEKQIPTVVEVLDVSELLPQTEETDCDYVQQLIDSVVAVSSPSDPVIEVSVRRGLEASSEDLRYEAPIERFWIMLNRRERSRADGLHEATQRQDWISDLDMLEVDCLVELETELSGSIQDSESGSCGGSYNEICRPSKKPRLCAQDQHQLLYNDFPAGSQSLDECLLPVSGDEGTATHRSSLSLDVLNCERNLALDPIQTVIPDDSDIQMRDSSDTVTTLIRPLSCEPDLANHSLGSFAFAQLRGRKLSLPRIEVSAVAEVVTLPRIVERHEPAHGPPPEIRDASTIQLPEMTIPRSSTHRYMACLELIQKRALILAFCSRNCAIELVERRDLDSMDLVIDSETAVLFFNLFSLPARCQAYLDKVANGSWKYSKILILFEAYNQASAKLTKVQGSTSSLPMTTDGESWSRPYAYTPPIVKALRKFRRDLSIAKSCGTMRTWTVVQYAFPDTVDEAALYTRLYGDLSEANDRTHGAVWGTRDWFDADIVEDEEAHLASLNGINHFSASIILSQVSLEEFVGLLPEERISAFGALVSPDRLRECNEDLDARLAAMQMEHEVDVL